MKNFKVIDLSRFSPDVAKEIADSMGVSVANGYIYVDGASAKLIKKMMRNRVAKNGGEEREQDVLLILARRDHSTLINYPNYMNDSEFLLNAIEYTPSPRFCSNYFYQYINKNLKNNIGFNFQFLTNVISHFGMEEAKHFATRFGLLELLNEMIADGEFRALNSSPSGKLAKIDY